MTRNPYLTLVSAAVTTATTEPHAKILTVAWQARGVPMSAMQLLEFLHLAPCVGQKMRLSDGGQKSQEPIEVGRWGGEIGRWADLSLNPWRPEVVVGALVSMEESQQVVSVGESRYASNRQVQRDGVLWLTLLSTSAEWVFGRLSYNLPFFVITRACSFPHELVLTIAAMCEAPCTMISG